MLASPHYELVDVGEGRKLERFGSYLLDRPSPAAENARRQHAALWRGAHARYERGPQQTGQWSNRGDIEPWTATVGPLTIELKLTPTGQVGLFPEQAENWRWIDEQVRAAGPLKVLNLFGYTGVSTLVAATAGAEVVHVDAAAGVVAWARRNAELSGLAAAPIRWIVEDAARFVRRELNRGNGYDAVLLDPPAYGHGPKGETWKLDADLEALLADCFALCRGRARFVLLSCHSGELATARGLRTFIEYRRGPLPGPPRKGEGENDGDLHKRHALRAEFCGMDLVSTSGARLPSGAAACWSRR